MAIDADLQSEPGGDASTPLTFDELLEPFPRRAPSASKRSGWLAVVAVIMAVFALAVSVMLISTRAERDDLAGEVDMLKAESEATQAQLDELQAQLDEANRVNELNNARVVQLSDENQQLLAQVPPQQLPSGPAPGTMQVVLTFDDGPHAAYTRQVMDVLEQHGLRGVFFVVGTEVEAHPEVAKEIVDRGHVIASHSWRHADLTKLSDDELRADLTRTSDVIESATGRRPACLRPPYGNVDDRVRTVAQSLGMSTVRWNVDPLDYQKPTAPELVMRIMNQVNGLGERGATVLMHDGGGQRDNTVSALPQLINDIQASGRQIVTICG